MAAAAPPSKLPSQVQDVKPREVFDSCFFIPADRIAEVVTAEPYDYIVVGSGPCSYAFVREIVDKATDEKRILVLERGDFYLTDHFQAINEIYKSLQGGVAITTPFAEDAAMKAVPQAGQANYFGGRSTIWTAWCPWPRADRQTPSGSSRNELRGFPPEVVGRVENLHDRAKELLNATGVSNAVMSNPEFQSISDAILRDLVALQKGTEGGADPRSETPIHYIENAVIAAFRSDDAFSYGKFSTVLDFLKLSGNFRDPFVVRSEGDKALEAAQREYDVLKNSVDLHGTEIEGARAVFEEETKKCSDNIGKLMKTLVIRSRYSYSIFLKLSNLIRKAVEDLLAIKECIEKGDFDNAFTLAGGKIDTASTRRSDILSSDGGRTRVDHGLSKIAAHRTASLAEPASSTWNEATLFHFSVPDAVELNTPPQAAPKTRQISIASVVHRLASKSEVPTYLKRNNEGRFDGSTARSRPLDLTAFHNATSNLENRSPFHSVAVESTMRSDTSGLEGVANPKRARPSGSLRAATTNNASDANDGNQHGALHIKGPGEVLREELNKLRDGSITEPTKIDAAVEHVLEVAIDKMLADVWDRFYTEIAKPVADKYARIAETKDPLAREQIPEILLRESCRHGNPFLEISGSRLVTETAAEIYVLIARASIEASEDLRFKLRYVAADQPHDDGPCNSLKRLAVLLMLPRLVVNVALGMKVERLVQEKQDGEVIALHVRNTRDQSGLVIPAQKSNVILGMSVYPAANLLQSSFPLNTFAKRIGDDVASHLSSSIIFRLRKVDMFGHLVDKAYNSKLRSKVLEAFGGETNFKEFQSSPKVMDDEWSKISILDKIFDSKDYAEAFYVSGFYEPEELILQTKDGQKVKKTINGVSLNEWHSQLSIVVPSMNGSRTASILRRTLPGGPGSMSKMVDPRFVFFNFSMLGELLTSSRENWVLKQFGFDQEGVPLKNNSYKQRPVFSADPTAQGYLKMVPSEIDYQCWKAMLLFPERYLVEFFYTHLVKDPSKITDFLNNRIVLPFEVYLPKGIPTKDIWSKTVFPGSVSEDASELRRKLGTSPRVVDDLPGTWEFWRDGSGHGLVHEASVLPLGDDGKDVRELQDKYVFEGGKCAIDTNYRFKGSLNVYVTGGGLFPNSGSWNPTLYMCAMAVDLAQRLERVADDTN